MCVLDCCRVRAAAAVVAAHRSLLASAMALNPNRRRPRVPSGRTPEKVAKPKAGRLYQLRARVTCEALDFEDPASASTELGIVITGGYRDDGGADCAQARYFDRQRGVVPFHDVPPSGPWDGQAVLGRYENFREADAPGNESNKMEESMQLQFDKTGEGECDVVGSGTNSFGKFFMCGTGERGSGGVWKLDVSRGYAGDGWSSDSLRAYAAPPVAAPASDFVASLVEAAAPAPARNYAARREARRAAHASAGAATRGSHHVARREAAVVRPATSYARFPVGEQVESTVKTFWPKDRGVVAKISGSRTEVVTTTGSVVVLGSSELEQTTLTGEEAGLCAATLERLRSSTKDYVQARIDGSIIFGDADRQIRNRYESAENGDELRQFEVRETDVRCALCPGHTWPLGTDIGGMLSKLRYHLDLRNRAAPMHRERLVATASDSSWRTPPLVPVTSTVPFAIGTHVESTVETLWEKNRGVVITEGGGGRREVVTTTGSVVVLKTTQLVQTTLNVDEVRRCEATRERLSSRKDYVQARIDGTIGVGDNNGREIRNRFKSAENDEELRQFEASETHVRCALCPDAQTWPLDTDTNRILVGIRGHLKDASGRTHRELLVAKASDSSWRTPIAPVAAPQPLAPVAEPIERERAVLQLRVGGIPANFFPWSGSGRSQGVVLHGSWHKIDGAEVKGWAFYGLDGRDNPPSLLEALPEGSMPFCGRLWEGDDRTPVDKIIRGEKHRTRKPDLIETRMTLRFSDPVDEVYKVDGDGENGKGDYTILGSAKRSDLCANQNFTASADGSTPSTRRLPRRRLRRLPEGAGPDSLVHFLTGSGSNGVWVLELERIYKPKVEEELPTRPRSPRPSTPMTVSDEYPNKGRWSVAEENYVNGISHLFFPGKLPDVVDGETLCKVLSELLCCSRKRVTNRIAPTRLGGRQKYKKSSEEPSPAELAALDELKRKFLLDKSLLVAEEEKSSEPAASSSTGTAMADVIPFLTEQNRPRVTLLKSDGPFELKTMLERSCLAEDPTRPCLRINAPLKDEATSVTVASVRLTFEGDAMDLTAAPPDGIFSGSVTTGKRSTFRRYPDRMHLHFEAVEEANTFKVDGYGVNDRIGKYRMEGTAVAQGDDWYLDMKRIRDPNAPDLPKPPNTKVCPNCERECKLLSGWASRRCKCECGEPLTESARIQKAYEAYAAAPDDEELARAYFDLLEPDPVIFRAVPYPAPLKLRTLLVEGTPDQFLAACALEPYVTRSRIPDDCIKTGCHLRMCKVKNAGGRGCYTHGAGSIEDATELCKVQVAGNVISSVDINQRVGTTQTRFSATTRPCWLDRTVRDRHLHAIDACDVHRHAVEQTSRRWRPSVDVATMV